MIFDSTLLFSNAQALSTSTSVASTTTIALSNARDMGMGDGIQPKVVGFIGTTAVLSACASATLQVQFQGSTNSSNWTTYMETGAMTTGSLSASSPVFEFDLPPRPNGVALPSYYRLNYVVAGNTSEVLSGSITAGIILQPAESPRTLGQYPAGFSVA